jgi:hypothetical protein
MPADVISDALTDVMIDLRTDAQATAAGVSGARLSQSQRELQQAQSELQQARSEVGREVQSEVRRALEEARANRADARAAARANAQTGGTPIAAPPPGPFVITEGGKKIVIGGPDGMVIQHPGAPGTAAPIGDIVPPEAVTISIAFFIMLAVIAIGWPLARAFARRIDKHTVVPKVPAEVTEQLRRLEEAVDTIAVEVERIAEGQRFSSRLLAEMHPTGGRVAASPAPVALPTGVAPAATRDAR